MDLFLPRVTRHPVRATGHPESPLRPILPLALLLLAGCQQPFDVTRKDLGPARIAAVGAVDDVLQAAIWSGQGAWHDQAPDLSWAVADTPQTDTTQANDEWTLLGTGWQVPAPPAGSTVQCSVIDADGATLVAQFTVASAPPVFTLTRQAVDLGTDLGTDLSLDARRAAPTIPIDASVAADQAQRLSLSWPTKPDTAALTTRWMSAAGLGTLLELDTFSADFLAEDIVFDDSVSDNSLIESRSSTGPGVYTQLALVMDGAGANRWSWIDAAVGVDTTLIHHEDRLLALDVDTSTGLVAVTLQSSDDLWGVLPTDPAAVTDLSDQDPLPCAAKGQPFRLAWIVEGRCARPDVLGARVVLAVQ